MVHHGFLGARRPSTFHSSRRRSPSALQMSAFGDKADIGRGVLVYLIVKRAGHIFGARRLGREFRIIQAAPPPYPHLKHYDRRATAASSSSSMFRRSVLNCSSKSAVDGAPYRSASVNATSAQSPGCNVSTIAGKTISSSKAICFLSLSMKSRTIRSTPSRRTSSSFRTFSIACATRRNRTAPSRCSA